LLPCVVCMLKYGFPYLLLYVPGADPGVHVSGPQVIVSHAPGGWLPLLSARPAVTFPAVDHHRPLAGTKLYCLMGEAHRCEQLTCPRLLHSFALSRFEPMTCPTFYPLHHRATYCMYSVSYLFAFSVTLRGS